MVHPVHHVYVHIRVVSRIDIGSIVRDVAINSIIVEAAAAAVVVEAAIGIVGIVAAATVAINVAVTSTTVIVGSWVVFISGIHNLVCVDHLAVVGLTAL